MEDGVIRTKRYVSTDGGLTFYEDKSQDGSGDDDPTSGNQEDLYRFAFDAADRVAAVLKFDDGVWKSLRLDDNESFAVDVTLGRARVIKTEVDDRRTEVEVYEDLDGDGDYVEIDSARNRDDDIYEGTRGSDRARGGLGDDDLYGNDGDDDLYGDDGQDDLFGDEGDDDLSGGKGDDELYGGGGRDRLKGDSGNDDLHGEEGNDDIKGGVGDDDLHGGNGVDKLTGGGGCDAMSGGRDADRFIFVSKLDSAVGAKRDVILDFDARQRDRIVLAAIDANEGASGNQAFTWLGTGAFTGVAGQLRYVPAPSPSGIVLQGDLNGDRTPDFELSLLGVTSLTAGQVVL